MNVVRIVSFSHDQATHERSLLELAEFEPPARGSTVSKDKLRKRLMAALAAQIDHLVDGQIDEISVVTVPQS